MPTPLAGQISVTGGAQPLSASTVSAIAFTIKAPLSNKSPVYIGPAGITTGTGHQLDPGDSFDYETRSQLGQNNYQLHVSDFYVVGTVNSPADKITWLASP